MSQHSSTILLTTSEAADFKPAAGQLLVILHIAYNLATLYEVMLQHCFSKLLRIEYHTRQQFYDCGRFADN